MSNTEFPVSSKRIAKGPPLHIQIYYTQGIVQSVHLASSPTAGMKWAFYSSSRDLALEDKLEAWLEAYSQNQAPDVKIPFAWTLLPLFTQHALQAIARIPLGAICSYGDVATLIGCPQGGRAIGGACRRNPFPLFIPCHRVLAAKQELRGYSAGGVAIKKALLTFEGIKIPSI